MELNLTQRARLALFFLSYLLFILFVGLRWETGNDWTEYYVYYTHLTSLRDNPSNNTFEIGYRFFNLVIKNIGLPYAGFLLIYSSTYLGLMFVSFRRENYTIAGWLVLQLFAPFILGLMGTARQVMAIAICMFSVRYLLSRDWRKFLMCVAVATTFHVSALAFVAAWPIARFRLSLRRLAILLVAVTASSLLHLGSLIMQYSQEIVGKLNNPALLAKLALEQESSSTQFHNAAGDLSVWYTVVRLCTLLFFVLSYRFFTEESDQLYFKLYIAGFCMLFLLSGAVFVLAERSALYFTIFQMHLLALPTRRLRRPILRRFYCVALIALSLTRLYTGIYLVLPRIFVPYKGVLINRDVKRDLGWFRNGL
jgi:hypothetical protein